MKKTWTVVLATLGMTMFVPGSVFAQVPGPMPMAPSKCPPGTQLVQGVCKAPPPPVVTCSAVPAVTVSSVGPKVIAVRGGDLVDISIAGKVELTSGCTLKSASYRLDDEYKTSSGSGAVTVGSDGGFSFNVTVEGSRKGTDKDGRSYKIVVDAVDEAGTGSSAQTSFSVAHDNRKK